MSTTDRTKWIKARASTGNGQCVEMRGHEAAVEVRDTKQHGAGPTLRVSTAGFAAWIDGAKNGEFDALR
jgi:predicted RNA-binding protein with TRAM domain